MSIGIAITVVVLWFAYLIIAVGTIVTQQLKAERALKHKFQAGLLAYTRNVPKPY